MKYQSTVERGFTLIEVMVALAVVAIALAALTRAVGMTASQQTAIESRVVAAWVAQDTLLQQQLFPSEAGQASLTQLNRQWQTTIRKEPTAVPTISKAVVEVREVNHSGTAVQEPVYQMVTVVGQ